MKTTKFQPKNRIPEFIARLTTQLNLAGISANIYDVGGDVKLDNVLLHESKPHTAPYDSHYTRNWHIVPDPTAKNGIIAVNNTYPNITASIKVSHHLNYEDWVRFNTIFNQVADELHISCNLKTSMGYIRQQLTWGIYTMR